MAPQFIDTHAHMFADQFSADREEAMQRAQQVLEAVYLPNIDETTITPMNRLAAQYPGFARPMMGLHPCHVQADYGPQLRQIEQELAHHSYHGVGETGLDLYWEQGLLEAQKASLRRHAEWARSLAKPLILHSRGAFHETADVVEEYQDGRLCGIFHCFTEDETAARRAIDLGFLLGLGGVLTFKKTQALRDTVARLPREAIVLETDSPYIAPQARRGRRNEASYTYYVAETLAEVWGTDLPTVAEITNANARRLFGEAASDEERLAE
jgi:TatD DNase family protein